MRPRPETITVSGYFTRGPTLFWVTADVRRIIETPGYEIISLWLDTQRDMAPLVNLSDKHRERIEEAIWEQYREWGTDQDRARDRAAS